MTFQTHEKQIKESFEVNVKTEYVYCKQCLAERTISPVKFIIRIADQSQ